MTQTARLILDVPAHLHSVAQAAVVHSLSTDQTNAAGTLSIVVQRSKDGWHCRASYAGAVWDLHDRDITASHYDEGDWLRREKELVRLGVMRVLQEALELPTKPWGILTGVRPTKMLHNMWDRGFSLAYMDTLLREIYGVSTKRRQWALEVAGHQRALFPEDPNRAVSVYVGIPFCPTRCGYCSFAAYPLATHGHLLKPFVQGLVEEITALGALLKELAIPVQTVYVGGGTPTVLQGDVLQQVLDVIEAQLQTAECSEYTVEAGRPETLTEDTVRRLRAAGVGRVSINPQTMRSATLQRIGRQHTPEDVEHAFELVRASGIPLINTDVILGLPGESLADVEYTLQRLEPLRPEHLTVHTLAWKRAAQWESQKERKHVHQNLSHVMVEEARNTAIRWGLIPYYLYRQRDIVGGLENIGYGRPGTESLYNIVMMEEKQTVLGVGAGAITKFVTAAGEVSRQANPKCPATYAQNVGNLVDQKKKRFEALLGV